MTIIPMRRNWRVIDATDMLDMFKPDIPAAERAWPPQYPLGNTPASQPAKLCDVKVVFARGRDADPSGYKGRVINGPVYESIPVKRRSIRNALANLIEAIV